MPPQSAAPTDGTPADDAPAVAPAEAPAPAKKAARRRATARTGTDESGAVPQPDDAVTVGGAAAPPTKATKTAKAAKATKTTKTAKATKTADETKAAKDIKATKEPAKRSRARKATDAAGTEPASTPPSPEQPGAGEPAETAAPRLAASPPTVMFVAPAPAPLPPPAATNAAKATKTAKATKSVRVAEAVEPDGDEPVPTRRRRTRAKAADGAPAATGPATEPDTDEALQSPATEERDADADSDGDAGDRRRRRRGRRGRGRGKGGDGENGDGEADGESAAPPQDDTAQTDRADGGGERGNGDATAGTKRRRHRRRAASGGDVDSGDDPPNTVVHVREPRAGDDEVQAVRGSTRLEAKRQRRRDGREQGRRRPPILTESEFLARREAVDRVMVVRQRGDRTQIAVLEDDVLVEHYISRASSTSYAGNVYLGRVQNVLPGMEAAFVDIGKGRNAVLYAGEVNWDAAGLDGRPRQIEQVLRSGDTLVVQVTKDPLGHKGARLTSQVSLPGRYLVYVPGGSMTGISRKLPDTERQRLKDILRRIVPDDAGVIIRTAAEGASEDELARDVARLQAQWEIIQKKAAGSGTSVPSLLYAEPDLAIRVVRDIFNEDFGKLVVSGDGAWDTLEQYVEHVAPDLMPRLHRHTAESDVFAEYRVDEQLAKALDRKVWLPSGGSLIIDRTEAMAVIDVNTGKFIGSKGGSSLEETVTRNNLEAAEEIVRQLRLRDIGGIIVIDFIDMVLESNRELVLRRLTECLGRDRTKHQVAEVTSLGLVQMTRKRVGQGLLEAFSEPCEVCRGRGVIIHTGPTEEPRRRNGAVTESSRRRKGRSTPDPVDEPVAIEPDLSPEDVEAAAAHAAGVPEETVQPSSGASEEAEVDTAPRRRRRRAATRPAGPPMSVTSASA
ncbi:MAG TPA: Rne/Rng family ribonuclease [Mycobacteriales bacterium]|nr:Rne/Rng family ribonuclease [Mycobacteriales bacterium]